MRRSLVAAALVAVVLALPAHATSFATDASDLWWNPSENGWGVNIIQQDDTLFLTFFVYAPSGATTWYVASSVTYQGTQGGALVYSGNLYQTTGPWFGGYFDPAAVGIRPVGTVTVSFDSISTATLLYSVDGTYVSKAIQRQTWKYNDISGQYLGATAGTYSGCAYNGYVEETGILAVSQTFTATGSTATATIAFDTGGSCTYSGAYTQDGRMGTINGSFSCTDGSSGAFLGYEIEATISGVSGRGTLTSGACTWDGRMGGLRRGS